MIEFWKNPVNLTKKSEQMIEIRKKYFSDTKNLEKHTATMKKINNDILKKRKK